VLSLAALGAGCDAGGLLEVEDKGSSGGPPVTSTAKGPSANEMVSAGTLARNGKYKLFYTMGQGTPQTVNTSADHRVNGGIVGAAHSQ